MNFPIRSKNLDGWSRYFTVDFLQWSQSETQKIEKNRPLKRSSHMIFKTPCSQYSYLCYSLLVYIFSSNSSQITEVTFWAVSTFDINDDQDIYCLVRLRTHNAFLLTTIWVYVPFCVKLRVRSFLPSKWNPAGKTISCVSFWTICTR